MRESSCCSPAGSGVLIRWKGGLSCWWMHEEEADRGSRRAAEFTPCLEKAPSCSIPLSFSIPPSSLHPSLRSFYPRLSLPLASVLAHTRSSCASSTFSASSSSCLPASLTPRGQSGRCTRTYSPAAFGPAPSSKVKVSGEEEHRRIVVPRGNRDTEPGVVFLSALLRPREKYSTRCSFAAFDFLWHAGYARETRQPLLADRLHSHSLYRHGGLASHGELENLRSDYAG